MSAMVKKYGKILFGGLVSLVIVTIVGIVVNLTIANSLQINSSDDEYQTNRDDRGRLDIELDHVEQLIQSGHIEKARKLCQKTIDSQPESIEAVRAELLLAQMTLQSDLEEHKSLLEQSSIFYVEDEIKAFDVDSVLNNLGVDKAQLADSAFRMAFIQSHYLEQDDDSNELYKKIEKNWPDSKAAMMAKIQRLKNVEDENVVAFRDKLIKEVLAQGDYTRQLLPVLCDDIACDYTYYGNRFPLLSHYKTLLDKISAESFEAKYVGVVQSAMMAKKSIGQDDHPIESLMVKVKEDFPDEEEYVTVLKKLVEEYDDFESFNDPEGSVAIYDALLENDPNNIEWSTKRLKGMVTCRNLRANAFGEYQAFLDKFSSNQHLGHCCYEIATHCSDENVYAHKISQKVSESMIERLPRGKYTLWAHTNLAKLAAKNNDQESLKSHIDIIQDVYFESEHLVEVIYQIAIIAVEQSDYQTAEALLEYVINESPQDTREPLAEVYLAGIYYEYDQAITAEEILNEFGEEENEEEVNVIADVIREIAFQYLDAKQLKAAEGLFRYLGDQWSDDDFYLEQAQTGMAIVRLFQGDPYSADNLRDDLKYSEILLKDDLDNDPLYILIERYSHEANRQLGQGNSDLATIYYEKALAGCHEAMERYDDLEMLYQVCQIKIESLISMGAYEKALESIQAYKADYPENELDWHIQFLEGYVNQQLKFNDQIEAELADKNTAMAYQSIAENYPNSPSAKIARQWLNENNVENHQ